MSLVQREYYDTSYIQDVYKPDCRPVVECGPGVTRESEMDSCDINKIVARFEKTGILPNNVREGGLFIDVSECGDYRDALDRVIKADKLFMQLPPKVRLEFANDPAKFLDYMADPANREDMVKRGIVEPGGAAAPIPVAPPAESAPGAS